MIKKIVTLILIMVLVLNTSSCNINKDANYKNVDTNIGNKLHLKLYSDINIISKEIEHYKYNNDFIKVLKALDFNGVINVTGLGNSSDKIFSIHGQDENKAHRRYCVSREGDIIPELSYPNHHSSIPLKGGYIIRSKYDSYYKGKHHYGVFDLEGKKILNEEYGVRYRYSDDWWLFNNEKEWILFDKDFNKMISWQYIEAPLIVNEGPPFYKPRDRNVKQYEWDLEAIRNQRVINYNDFTNFDGKYILAYNGEKFGYIDTTGNQLTDFCYDGGYTFKGREYTSVAKRNDNNEYKWGLIDKNGNLIIDYIYDSPITGGYDGIFAANMNGDGYYINIKNETLLNNLKYDFTASFNSDGIAWVQKNNKWGLIYKNGTEVCPCIFDIKSDFNDGLAIVSYNNIVLLITYKDPSYYGYTYDDVNMSIKKLSKISEDEKFWDNLIIGFQDKISKNNWTEEDYVNDINYTTTYKNILPDAWYVTTAGIWYYFENDRETTKKGWFIDDRDGQTYYLDPKNGRMAVGWKEIDGDLYYFNESHANEPNWYEIGEGFYESYGKKIKAYGSMYRDEITPDGRQVDGNGRLIE